MKALRTSLIRIAVAQNMTEAIGIELLLNRAGIDYKIQGEHTHRLYGAVVGIWQPIEFLIREHDRELAEGVLDDLFDVDVELPEHCPACNHTTERGRLDCPSCGLFLG